MAQPRDYAWGAVAGLIIVVGHAVTPSGTFFEWAAVGLAFLIGLLFAALSRHLLSWREIGQAALGSLLFAVCGLGLRMWANDTGFIDTALLIGEGKYIWPALQAIGYWLLAGLGGYALAAKIRISRNNPHVHRAL